jgi:hypothetical protein
MVQRKKATTLETKWLFSGISTIPFYHEKRLDHTILFLI